MVEFLIVLVSNLVIWGLFLLLARKVQPYRKMDSTYHMPQIKYEGETTTNFFSILPIILNFCLMFLLAFFSPTSRLDTAGRLHGVLVLATLALMYGYILFNRKQRG